VFRARGKHRTPWVDTLRQTAVRGQEIQVLMRYSRKVCVAGCAAVVAVGAYALSGPASAQDLPTQLADQQSIPIGEADLYPSIRIDYQTNDNVGLKSEDEVDGTATILQPTLVLVAEARSLTFQGAYEGAFSLGSLGAIDWNDHSLSAGLSAEFDSRRRARVDATLERQHLELGSTITRGRGDEFDEPVVFNQFRLGGSFGYGAAAARGNITAGVNIASRSYTNLDEVTDGRDFNSIRPFGRFGYRIGGDTRATIELRAAAIDFDASVQDRREIGLLLGVSFNATGRLSGTFGVGFDNVDFSADGREDATLFVVESNLQFRPRSFALLTLDISRGINNAGLELVSNDSGESIETVVRAGWQHDWSSRVSSAAFVSANVRDEICPSLGDSIFSAGFEFNVSLRRWLQLGAGVSAASRQVDRCTVDDGSESLSSDRQLAGIHLRATL